MLCNPLEVFLVLKMNRTPITYLNLVSKKRSREDGTSHLKEFQANCAPLILAFPKKMILSNSRSGYVPT